MIKAVTQASGDASYDTASAEAYGVYTPKKLYIHMWKENQITMDWEKPLKAFNGETSLAVARKAFKFHHSQQTGRYWISVKGKYDSRQLGLYWTTVGVDEAKNDLLEHID